MILAVALAASTAPAPSAKRSPPEGEGLLAATHHSMLALLDVAAVLGPSAAVLGPSADVLGPSSVSDSAVLGAATVLSNSAVLSAAVLSAAAVLPAALLGELLTVLAAVLLAVPFVASSVGLLVLRLTVLLAALRSMAGILAVSKAPMRPI